MVRNILKVTAGLLAAGLFGVLGANVFAWARSRDRIAGAQDVPAQPVGLVLGAEVYPDGQPSRYLKGRLDLAYELFRTGKVEVLLVSGDNGSAQYNETDAMRDYLITRGVPSSKVVGDYAGFDTYSSCVRAKRIFGVSRLTVITQAYHLPRAVAICRTIGLDAWGVGDTSVRSVNPERWNTFAAREIPANVKMALDLITARTPVLGVHEDGVDRALRA